MRIRPILFFVLFFIAYVIAEVVVTQVFDTGAVFAQGGGKNVEVADPFEKQPGLEDDICRVIALLNGGVARGIAATSIVFLGYMMFMGSLAWPVALAMAVGTSMVFGSEEIVKTLNPFLDAPICSLSGEEETIQLNPELVEEDKSHLCLNEPGKIYIYVENPATGIREGQCVDDENYIADNMAARKSMCERVGKIWFDDESPPRCDCNPGQKHENGVCSCVNPSQQFTENMRDGSGAGCECVYENADPTTCLCPPGAGYQIKQEGADFTYDETIVNQSMNSYVDYREPMRPIGGVCRCSDGLVWNDSNPNDMRCECPDPENHEYIPLDSEGGVCCPKGKTTTSRDVQCGCDVSTPDYYAEYLSCCPKNLPYDPERRDCACPSNAPFYIAPDGVPQRPQSDQDKSGLGGDYAGTGGTSKAGFYKDKHGNELPILWSAHRKASKGNQAYCGCPGEMEFVDGSCQCPNTTTVKFQDGSTTILRDEFDHESGKCCPPNLTWNGSECACADPTKVVSDYSTCCRPDQKADYYGHCVCKDSLAYEEGNACNCPAGASVMGADHMCKCTGANMASTPEVLSFSEEASLCRFWMLYEGGKCSFIDFECMTEVLNLNDQQAVDECRRLRNISSEAKVGLCPCNTGYLESSIGTKCGCGADGYVHTDWLDCGDALDAIGDFFTDWSEIGCDLTGGPGCVSACGISAGCAEDCFSESTASRIKNQCGL